MTRQRDIDYGDTGAFRKPAAEQVECSWCGLRVASVTVVATPTCTECAVSPKTRKLAYMQRLKRAAKR